MSSDESEDEAADMELIENSNINRYPVAGISHSRFQRGAVNSNRSGIIFNQHNGNQPSCRARDIESEMERIILMEAVARGVNPVNFDEDPQALEEMYAEGYSNIKRGRE